MYNNLRSYRFDELDGAPDSPGIYAWYADIELGIADWRVDPDAETGRDRGFDRLRSAMLSYSKKHSPGQLSLVADGAFSDRWKGQLTATFEERIDGALLKRPSTKEGMAIADHFNSALRNEKTRSLFVDSLKAVTPCFTAPIYIGVATKSLRTRLKNHSNKILRLYDRLDQDPALKDRLLKDICKKEGNFAARVVARDFSIDQLTVYVHDLTSISDNQVDASELESLAQALEWLLNRWHRPICGRK